MTSFDLDAEGMFSDIAALWSSGEVSAAKLVGSSVTAVSLADNGANPQLGCFELGQTACLRPRWTRAPDARSDDLGVASRTTLGPS
jgi:hypothetical protein